MLKKLLLVGGLLACASVVLAQEPDVLDMPALVASAIIALVPTFSAILTFFVRQLIPKIPKVALPLVSAGLGIGLQAFLAWQGGQEFNPVVGAILGACGTWLREIINTFNEWGTSS
jgi:drug/metabolite transporter (DMT)-like permease